MQPKDAGRIANSEDPDLGLHWLACGCQDTSAKNGRSFW